MPAHVVPIVIASGVLAIAWLPPRRKLVLALVERAGAPPDPASFEIARRFLSHRRRYRASGAVLGWFALPIVIGTSARLGYVPMGDQWLLAFAGYLLGAIAACAAGASVGTASARQEWPFSLARVMAGVTVVLSLVYWRWYGLSSARGSVPSPVRASLVAVLAVATAALVWRTRRRHPPADGGAAESLVATLRTANVRALAGAGSAASILLAWVVIGQLVALNPTFNDATSGFDWVLRLPYAAIACWAFLGPFPSADTAATSRAQS
jgi:hypothetical protein